MISFWRRVISGILIAALMITPLPAGAWTSPGLLPAPSGLMHLSEAWTAPFLKGLVVNPQDPFRMDFIVDPGHLEAGLMPEPAESAKLVKYFLAALTIPQDELWVNLSPYESDRVIPLEFGQTLMGQDLLAQDYLLKQLMSSLTYPENELGEVFWQTVRQQAGKLYPEQEFPLNAFFKVWIVPGKAVVYEQGTSVMILESDLRVMMESDYLAMLASGEWSGPSETAERHSLNSSSAEHEVTARIAREVILPHLEKEVNQGRHFANLRQIYHAMILASWYKDRLRDNVVNRVYANRKFAQGVDGQTDVPEHIYEKYLEAFRQGAYELMREEYDPARGDVVARRYFSGGVLLTGGHLETVSSAMGTETPRITPVAPGRDFAMASVNLQPRGSDAAMMGWFSRLMRANPRNQTIATFASKVENLEEQYKTVLMRLQTQSDFSDLEEIFLDSEGAVAVLIKEIQPFVSPRSLDGSLAQRIFENYLQDIQRVHTENRQLLVLFMTRMWPQNKPKGWEDDYQSFSEEVQSTLQDWRESSEEQRPDYAEDLLDALDRLAAADGYANRRTAQDVLVARLVATMRTRWVGGARGRLNGRFESRLLFETYRQLAEQDDSRATEWRQVLGLRPEASETEIWQGITAATAGLSGRVTDDEKRQFLEDAQRLLGQDLRRVWQRQNWVKGISLAPGFLALAALGVGLTGDTNQLALSDETRVADQTAQTLKPESLSGVVGENKKASVASPDSSVEAFLGEFSFELLPAPDNAVAGDVGDQVDGNGGLAETTEESPEIQALKKQLAEAQEDNKKIENAVRTLEAEIAERQDVGEQAKRIGDELSKKMRELGEGKDPQEKPVAEVPSVAQMEHWNEPQQPEQMANLDKPTVSPAATGSETGVENLNEVGSGFKPPINGYNGNPSAGAPMVSLFGARREMYVATARYFRADLKGNLIPTKSSFQDRLITEPNFDQYAVMNANGQKELMVPMPPGYEISGVRTQDPVRSYRVQTDPESGRWRILFSETVNGSVQIGIRPSANHEFPKFQILGEDRQPLSAEAFEASLREILPATVMDYLDALKARPAAEHEAGITALMNLFTYTTNPYLATDGRNVLQTMFDYFAGECAQFSFLDAVIRDFLGYENMGYENILIGRGFLDSDRDGVFRAGVGHSFLILLQPNGTMVIQESTADVGNMSSLYKREGVTPGDWMGEKTILERAAEPQMDRLAIMTAELHARVKKEELAQAEAELAEKQKGLEEQLRAQTQKEERLRSADDNSQIKKDHVYQTRMKEYEKRLEALRQHAPRLNLEQAGKILKDLESVMNKMPLGGEILATPEGSADARYVASALMIIDQEVTRRKNAATPEDSETQRLREISWSIRELRDGLNHRLNHDATQEKKASFMPTEFLVMESWTNGERWIVEANQWVNLDNGERVTVPSALGEEDRLVAHHPGRVTIWGSHDGFLITGPQAGTFDQRLLTFGDEAASLKAGLFDYLFENNEWLGWFIKDGGVSYIGPIAERMGLQGSYSNSGAIQPPITVIDGKLVIRVQDADGNQRLVWDGPDYLRGIDPNLWTKVDLPVKVKNGEVIVRAFNDRDMMIAVYDDKGSVKDVKLFPGSARAVFSLLEVNPISGDYKTLVLDSSEPGGLWRYWGTGLGALENERFAIMDPPKTYPHKEGWVDQQVLKDMVNIGSSGENISIVKQTLFSEGGGMLLEIIEMNNWQTKFIFYNLDEAANLPELIALLDENGFVRPEHSSLRIEFKKDTKGNPDLRNYLIQTNGGEFYGPLADDIPEGWGNARFVRHNLNGDPVLVEIIDGHLNHLTVTPDSPSEILNAMYGLGDPNLVNPQPQPLNLRLKNWLLAYQKFQEDRVNMPEDPWGARKLLFNQLEDIFGNIDGTNVSPRHFNPAQIDEIFRVVFMEGEDSPFWVQLFANSSRFNSLFELHQSSDVWVDLWLKAKQMDIWGLFKGKVDAVAFARMAGEYLERRAEREGLTGVRPELRSVNVNENDTIRQLRNSLKGSIPTELYKLLNEFWETRDTLNEMFKVLLSELRMMGRDSGEKPRLNNGDLNEFLDLARQHIPMLDDPFDVELSREAKNHPLFQMIQLLRKDIPELKTYSPDNQTRYENWQAFNQKLNETLGNDFNGAGEIDALMVSIHEISRDIPALLTLWILLSTLLNFAVVRSARDLGPRLWEQSGQKAIRDIFDNNPWLDGYGAGDLPGIRERLEAILTIGREMTDEQVTELQKMRGELSERERLVVDVILSLPLEFPQVTAKTDLWRGLLFSLVPVVGATVMYDRNNFKRRAELNERLKGYVAGVSPSVSLQEFYEGLWQVLEPFLSSVTNESASARQNELPDGEEFSRDVQQRIQELGRVIVPGGNRSGESEIGSTSREYVPGDDPRYIDQNATARRGGKQMVRPREELKSKRKVAVMFDFRGMNAEGFEYDRFRDEMAKSLMALDPRTRRVDGGGSVDYEFSGFLIVMPNGESEFVKVEEIQRRVKEKTFEAKKFGVIKEKYEEARKQAEREREIRTKPLTFYDMKENVVYLPRRELTDLIRDGSGKGLTESEILAAFGGISQTAGMTVIIAGGMLLRLPFWRGVDVLGWSDGNRLTPVQRRGLSSPAMLSGPSSRFDQGSDFAMASEVSESEGSQSQKVGGIDLNAAWIQWERQGQSDVFGLSGPMGDFPAELLPKIDGLTPVILQTVPVPNVLMIFGSDDSADSLIFSKK